MSMTKVETIEQFEALLETKEPYILFKHSTTCPISQGAFTEFQAYCQDGQITPAYYLYVQDARAISNRIAEHFGIKHESPQVLYIKDGTVAWHTSHWKIKKQSLEENVK
ncbi:bacillithiol system redox-active protein YtxJ [Bacillus sp. DX4.1]|uniref:bacillithiol system redox-active protein YtxJ n=1 Tax=Bacillus sp. DX4.1 TaxID=3055867 RepID=UPI0025A285B0|nr:bacillithiol system redox-active protein YtxJ [Bacillus sp. DX4.1]MDM5190351.1 bacillithiol system redox-active protein YtxJ [Bacillus sp. DX4.1]